jgi:hypothetical protein
MESIPFAPFKIFLILFIFRFQSELRVSLPEVSNAPILPTDQGISIFWLPSKGAKIKPTSSKFSAKYDDHFLKISYYFDFIWFL